MLAELTLSSWETVLRRTSMMASGACSPAEFQRMVTEKATAAALSGKAARRRKADLAALLAPWHSRASANAKRLRGK